MSVLFYLYDLSKLDGFCGREFVYCSWLVGVYIIFSSCGCRSCQGWIQILKCNSVDVLFVSLCCRVYILENAVVGWFVVLWGL